VSGIDDLHGASFEKALDYLKKRAEQDDAFNWKISIELDQVISSAFKSLLRMIFALNDIAAEKPDRRTVTIRWCVKPSDDSMSSIAKNVKAELDRRRQNGAQLQVIKSHIATTSQRP
jgi:hypothetical protein